MMCSGVLYVWHARAPTKNRKTPVESRDGAQMVAECKSGIRITVLVKFSLAVSEKAPSVRRLWVSQLHKHHCSARSLNPRHLAHECVSLRRKY